MVEWTHAATGRRESPLVARVVMVRSFVIYITSLLLVHGEL